MFIRIVNLKFSSNIESDAMHALAKHELINILPGIISIEVIKISELHSIAINKFASKESADESRDVIINKLKSKIKTYDDWNINLVDYESREKVHNAHEKYLQGLEIVEDNSLDLVLVDGRHRVECIRASMPKVKKNGYIILDDSDRTDYLDSYEILKAWESFVISGYAYMSDFKTHSTVWKKP